MTPHHADIYAGQRLRAARTDLRISQQSLGHQIGVTFQQIQKYEKGSNRISVSKLHQFAIILKKDPNYFFKDYRAASSTATRDTSKIKTQTIGPKEKEDILVNAENAMNFIKLYAQLPPEYQKTIKSLFKALEG